MNQPSAAHRLDSIDALRGVAILLMMVDHSFDWWLAAPYRDGSADKLTGFLGTLAAPIFLVLVGVGLALSLDRQRARGGDLRRWSWRMIRRGLVIIAVGYLMNLAVFFVGDNLYDVFAVDVLQVIGLGLILAVPLALTLPALPLFALAVGWAVAGALWGGSFTLPPVLGAWINGETGIGYFPLLPWLAYVWLGIGVGRLVARRLDRREGELGAFSGPLLLTALGWLVATVLVPNVGYRHPRLGHIALSLAVFFALWGVLYRLQTLSEVTRRGLVVPLAFLGRTALFIYVFHHLLGYRLLYMVGWVTGRAWRGQFGVMTPPQALAGFLLLTVISALAALVWARYRGWLEAHTLGYLPGFGDMRRGRS